MPKRSPKYLVFSLDAFQKYINKYILSQYILQRSTITVAHISRKSYADFEYIHTKTLYRLIPNIVRFYFTLAVSKGLFKSCQFTTLSQCMHKV